MVNTQSSSNRRQHPRASIKSSVLLSFGERAGGGVGVDLSEGGMRVVTPATIEPSEPVRMVIDLEGKPIQALGKIIHGDAYRGYGLKFVLVRREGMQIIRQYIAARGAPSAKS
jgi:hypothetical protein